PLGQFLCADAQRYANATLQGWLLAHPARPGVRSAEGHSPEVSAKTDRSLQRGVRPCGSQRAWSNDDQPRAPDRARVLSAINQLLCALREASDRLEESL